MKNNFHLFQTGFIYKGLKTDNMRNFNHSKTPASTINLRKIKIEIFLFKDMTIH